MRYANLNIRIPFTIYSTKLKFYLIIMMSKPMFKHDNTHVSY